MYAALLRVSLGGRRLRCSASATMPNTHTHSGESEHEPYNDILLLLFIQLCASCVVHETRLNCTDISLFLPLLFVIIWCAPASASVGYGKVGDRYTQYLQLHISHTFARMLIFVPGLRCFSPSIRYQIYRPRYDTAVIIDVIIVILALLSLLIT